MMKIANGEEQQQSSPSSSLTPAGILKIDLAVQVRR